MQGNGIGSSRTRTDHLKDIRVDEGIILKWIFKEIGWGVDLFDLVQDRDRWRALVNTVMKLQFA